MESWQGARFTNSRIRSASPPHHEGLEQIEGDGHRDQVFHRSGFQTLRFTTRAVHEDVDAVMGMICQALNAASPTRPLRGHPPHEGEGRVLS
ncbi:MAG: DUF559 domain-containing protein [Caulobacter sp.]|nr:DUF559 domain-containing protein [Caulobacter sp.]